MRLEYEGLSKCDAVVTKGARFFNDPAGFALERYAYYVCFKCKKAYYGGEVQCDADAGIGDEYNPVIIFFGCHDFQHNDMQSNDAQREGPTTFSITDTQHKITLDRVSLC